jgi:hypothetical protein
VISERIIDLVDPDAPAKLHALHLREAAYESEGGPSVAKNFTNALANLASAWSTLTDTAEPAKDTDAHITSANESALYILNNSSGLYNRSIIERDPSEGQLDSLKNPFLRSLNATQKKRAGAPLSELLTNAKRLQSASNPMEVTRLQKTQDELINDIKAILLKEDLANHSYSRAVKMLLEKNLPCAVSEEVLTMLVSKYPLKSTNPEHIPHKPSPFAKRDLLTLPALSISCARNQLRIPSFPVVSGANFQKRYVRT